MSLSSSAVRASSNLRFFPVYRQQYRTLPQQRLSPTFQQSSDLQLGVVDEVLAVPAVYIPVARFYRCSMSAIACRVCGPLQPTEAVTLGVEVLISLLVGHDVGAL